jgi:hypothetical protein
MSGFATVWKALAFLTRFEEMMFDDETSPMMIFDFELGNSGFGSTGRGVRGVLGTTGISKLELDAGETSPMSLSSSKESSKKLKSSTVDGTNSSENFGKEDSSKTA